MNPFKKLFQQTAIYGLSSIIGRALNYLLVPLYTRIFSKSEYGVVTDLYAMVGFLIVALTYGMETALFRFVNQSTNKLKVYSTALISLVCSSTVFLIIALSFSSNIAGLIQYSSNKEYIIWFALILAFDALGALPFAKLRVENKAGKFALIKLTEIALNIGLNLFFLVLCRNAGDGSWLSSLYSPQIGIGYIFISNLVASGVKIVMLLPLFKWISNGFSAPIFKQMITYAWPLIFVGLAGVANEMLDRTLLKYLLPYNKQTNLAMLGIYGACYKLSILMTLFIQAFRYAGEPFFFNMSNNKNAKPIYATVLKFFVIFGTTVFLIITCFIGFFKHFIGANFWEGLPVVPILLLANLFLGIMVNLNIWYKLTNKTIYGAFISIAGALLTILLNVWWIPTLGYKGSAWATLIVYFAMCVASYILGQKHYPVKYPLRKILLYISLAILLFLVSNFGINNLTNSSVKVVLNIIVVLGYLSIVYFFEKQQLRNMFKQA